MSWGFSRLNCSDPQTLGIVTMLNAVGVAVIFPMVAAFLEGIRSGAPGETVFLPALTKNFWPIELWIVSICASQWLGRKKMPAVAILIALLPTIAESVARVARLLGY